MNSNSDWATMLLSDMPWYAKILLIIILLGVALYAVKHLKRDKQGKWYWYSSAYEGSKRVKRMLEDHMKSDKDHFDRIYSVIREAREDRHALHDELTKRFDVIDSRLNTLEAHSRELYMENLKQSFYLQGDPEMPFPDLDRLYAGLRYIKEGGNGTVKEAVTKFKALHEDLYQTIVRMKPELGVI